MGRNASMIFGMVCDPLLAIGLLIYFLVHSLGLVDKDDDEEEDY